MSMGNMAIAKRSSAKAIILLGLALLSCVADGVSRGHLFKASARRSVAVINRKVFDVTAFGAKTEDQMKGGKSTAAGVKLDLPSLPGDDEKVDDEKMDSSEEEAGPGEAGPGESPSDDNASAFIKTWVAACRGNYSGPATVLIPKGTFMTGPVIFQGPCTSSKEPILVEVEGYVKASTDLSLYASPEWFTFETIDGLIVTGEGTFDGQGEATWKSSGCPKDKSSCAQAPSSLKFNHVNNSLVERITSLNSKFFHAHIYGCSNLTMNNVHITAPDESPNTDGVHISTSTNVKVLNSVIGTGDDCVSIGQGSNDILVNNITCGPGHGISVGSLGKRIDDKSVSKILVSNCTLRNTTNGARIKTWAAESAGEASDITYENIVMDQVQNPIVIDQHYGKTKPKPGTGPAGGPASKWKISNVHFRNIRGTSSRNIAVSLQCSSSNPCDGIEMADINFSYLGAAVKDTALTTECYNAKIAPKGVQIPPLCP